MVAKNISVSVELEMDALPANDTNTTGRFIPGIRMGDIVLSIDREQVDFNFGGSPTASFVNLFTGAFLDYMINQVEATIISQMNLTIPLIVNFEFATIDGYLIPFDHSMPKF